jgi:hypothetical protein
MKSTELDKADDSEDMEIVVRHLCSFRATIAPIIADQLIRRQQISPDAKAGQLLGSSKVGT